MPPSAHVARTTIERDGVEYRIFRRNVAYGGVTDHGTAFVGFAQDRWRMHEMLRRMAGATDRIRDGLTRWLTPLTGAYYTVPSGEPLARFPPRPRPPPPPPARRAPTPPDPLGDHPVVEVQAGHPQPTTGRGGEPVD